MRGHVVVCVLCGLVATASPRTPLRQSLEAAVVQAPAIVAIEGVRHLVYELHLTNLGAGDVALARIEVVDADRKVVLGELRDGALQAAIGRPGSTPKPPDPRQLGPGLRAVVYA